MGLTRIQLRRGTDAQWQAANPVLAAGEPGYAIDTEVFKIGNGVDAWTVLNGIQGGGSGGGGGTTASITTNPGASLVIDAADLDTVQTLVLNHDLTVSFGASPGAGVAGDFLAVFVQPATGGPFNVIHNLPAGLTFSDGAPAPGIPTNAGGKLAVNYTWTGQMWLPFYAGTF